MKFYNSNLSLFLFLCATFLPTTLIAQSKTIPNEKSHINFQLEITYSAIEKAINNNLPKVLLEDNSFENNKEDGLKTKILKNGNISVKRHDAQLMRMDIPLKILATKRLGVWGVYTYQKFDFSMTMRALISGEIDSKGRLKTKTTISDFIFDKEASLSVLDYEIDITPIIKEQLEADANDYAKSIDQSIAENLPMQSVLLDLVNYFSQPIQVSEEYNTWIQLSAESVEYQKFTLSENAILSTFEILSTLETYVRSGTPFKKEIRSLPTIYKKEKIQNRGEIHSYLFIPYAEASKLSKKELKNESYSFKNGKYNFTIKDIEIGNDEDKMQINLTTEGDYNGTIIISGYPQYDEGSQMIFLQDSDFGLKTKNLIHRVGGMILEKPIQKKIENDYGVPVKDNLEEVKKELQEGLNSNFNDAVHLEGKLLHFDISDTRSSKDGIYVYYDLQYQVRAKVKNLEEF